MTTPLSEAVADTLRAAYYYAMADGHPAVDPGLVLMAAARNDKKVAHRVLGSSVAEARQSLKNDRRSTVATGPVVAAGCTWAGDLREARWWVLRDNGPEDRADPAPITSTSGGPVWDDSVCSVLDLAAHLATGPVLGMPTLLQGLLDSGHPSVPALAALSDTSLDNVRVRLEGGAFEPEPVQTGPFIGAASVVGGLQEQRLVPRWTFGLVRRILRDADERGVPVFFALEQEAVRQAVILGHPVVQSSALLLAVLSMDEQLSTAGRLLHEQYQPDNRGGETLRARGLSLVQARLVAGNVRIETDLVPPDRAAAHLTWQYTPADPGWTTEALLVWQRAAEVARERGAATRGTSHLVEAIEATQAPAAHRVLAAFGAAPGPGTGLERGDG